MSTRTPPAPRRLRPGLPLVTRSPRSSLALALALATTSALVFAAGMAGCVERKAIESTLTCPCAPGFFCDDKLEICVRDGLATAAPGDPTIHHFFERRSERKLDVLFVVDNSVSMTPLQQRLVNDFDTFTNGLKSIAGGLPDLHLGVVDTDRFSDSTFIPSGCNVPDEEVGLLRNTPSSPGGPAPRGSFITASADGSKNNFHGDITDVFRSIALVGDTGCGFEQPLAAARRALEPARRPTANEGFLRDDAYLALVVLANEDDCSAREGSALFEFGTDRFGPRNSFRCNRFGHVCNDAPPPDSPASALLCEDAPAATSELVPVSDYVTFFASLKRDPRRFLPSIIAGPTTPYDVVLQRMQTPTGEIDAATVAHSCTTMDSSYADPAIRLKQLADAFPATGVFESICAPSFRPTLEKIATTISRVMESQCIQGFVLDRDPSTQGLQPACRVAERNGDGSETAIPTCEDSRGASPCWTVVADATSCPVYGKKLSIQRDGNPSETNATIKCETCARANDPRCK